MSFAEVKSQQNHSSKTTSQSAGSVRDASETSESSPSVKAPGTPVPPDCTQGAYLTNKDHVVAGFFALFLGALGMHKFYLGYHVTGFTMLAATIIGSVFTLGVAGGVMAVIGIIEGILYLSEAQSNFICHYVVQRREWF